MKIDIDHIITLIVLLLWNSADGQTGIEIVNRGIGGNTSKDLLNRIEQDVLADDPDLVLLMVGTNDLLNSRKMLSFEEYRNNVERLILKLQEEGVEVVLMSPTPVDTVYLFQRHDREKFMRPPNEKLEIARDLLHKLSKEYDCYFIDIYENFKTKGIPDHNRDDIIRNEYNSDSADGVHLTKKGNQFLGSFIFRKLLESGKINREIKIICFGDSLTFGASMKGKGTSTGDTYPAVLKEALEMQF